MYVFLQIEKIRLGQDSRGYDKGLFVDSVRVVPTDGDPAVMFPCACWLAEDVWESKTERELLPGKAVKRPESMCRVEIVLYINIQCLYSGYIAYECEFS